MASMGFDGTPIGGLALEQFDLPYILTGKSTKELIIAKVNQIQSYRQEQALINQALKELAIKNDKATNEAIKNNAKGLFAGLFKIAKTAYETFRFSQVEAKREYDAEIERRKIAVALKEKNANIKKIMALLNKVDQKDIIDILLINSIGKPIVPTASTSETTVSAPVQNQAEDYYTETPEVPVATPIAQGSETTVTSEQSKVENTGNLNITPVVESNTVQNNTAPAENIVSQNEAITEIISDEVYNNFTDNKGVPENLLKDIAQKITEGKPVSPREIAIIADKDQIEKINEQLVTARAKEKITALEKEITEMEAKLSFNPQLKDQVLEAKRDLESMKEKAGLNVAPVAQQAEAQPEVVTEAAAETAPVAEKPVAELTDAERIAKFTQIENERKQKEQEAYNKRSQEIIAAQNAQRAAQAQVAQDTTNTNA